MIYDDALDKTRIDDFIMSLLTENDKDILELKKFAIENDVPIIRDETKSFLRLIINLKRPENVLEIGTAIAYSTLVIHRSFPEAKIVTIENYEKRITEAKKNIDKFFGDGEVELVEDDASVYLKNSDKDNFFDLVFLDGAKAQYINWINDIKRLMKKNAILISDNIFKEGEILESKFLIRKRDRTIHKKMREFLHFIAKDEDFDTYIFNIGDGLSVSIKK